MSKRVLKFIWIFSFAFIILLISPGYSTLKGEVRLKARQLIFSQQKEKIILKGDVRFYYKNAILAGDRAVFNTRSSIGKMEGNVRIYQPGTTITGDKMLIRYKNREAELLGDVRIVSVKDISSASPRVDEKMLLSGVTTLTCKSLKYLWVKREGWARGGITVSQKNRRAFADRAHYSGGSEIIVLEGKVRFEQGANNWVTCKKAIIDLRRETFMAVGGVTGNFLVEDQTTKEKKPKKSERIPDMIILPKLPFEESSLPD